MKMPMELRKKPFDKYNGLEKDNIRYEIKAYSKVINHEELLVVEFIANPQYISWSYRGYKYDKSFRLVISKKNKDYCVICDGQAKGGKSDITRLVYSYDYCDISEASKKIIKSYIGCKKYHLSYLLALMNDYHDIKIEEHRANSGYINDDTVYDCPKDLPEGFIEYIEREIIGQDKTLIYKKGNIRGTCAYCGEKVKANGSSGKFTQYSFVRCPNCNEKVQCVLEGSGRWKTKYVANVVCMQRKDNAIWFRQFHIHRDITARYEYLENYIEEIARYVIIGNKSAAWRNEAKYNTYMHHSIYKFDGWERYKSYDVYDGWYNFYCYDIEETVKGTVLQYAELGKYIELEKNNIVKYSRYFVKYPVLEFLIKKEMYQVITDKLCGYATNRGKNNGIYWERKKLKECFKFPIRLLEMFSPAEWTLDKINQCNMYYKQGIKDSEIRVALENNLDIDSVLEVAKYVSISKTVRYLKSQYDGNNYWRTVNLYRTYRDYLNDCRLLECDMKSKSILFPKDLEAAHQRTTEMVKYETSKHLDENILKVYKKLSKKAFEENGLLIRPAKSSKELIREGAALHHCVGGYAEKVAKGETSIFFIRNADSKKKAYFTLEYKDGAVIQCRTLNNRSYETEEKVKVFVEHWLKKIKKGA